MIKIRQALLSVSDKTGVVEFARGLQQLGIRLISTGGTAKLLAEAGLTVVQVSDYTGFAEMLDGRVKTLHPKIHAGLLACRDKDEHMATLAQHQIDTIDLVCVNLYPFSQTVAKSDVQLADAIENIDIGGPAMIRSAAKNYMGVAVVTDPADYPSILNHLQKQGGLSQQDNFALAKKAFAHTARYDGAIANWLSRLDAHNQLTPWPATLHLAFDRAEVLRYGENPHQSAAFYREYLPAGVHKSSGFADFTQLQGKELSYNNIADADAAWACVRQFALSNQAACVIVKHANPCGVAIADNMLSAYEKAFATDPTSAFGGILAFNRKVESDVISAMQGRNHFVEVIIAPEFDPAALTLLAAKPNIRVLTVPLTTHSANQQVSPTDWDYKRISAGLLLQSFDHQTLSMDDIKVVSKRQPTPAQLQDLLFAWRVAKYVKSNAIVFCRHQQTLGVGAGQMSRVDSTKIATIKAAHAGLSLDDSVVASDAFFPFRDGIDVLAAAGATAVIQPGGSVRDAEVIAAADEHHLVMLFTGMRHFRH